MTTVLLTLETMLLTLSVGCSRGEVRCGPGTTLQDGACVVVETTVAPAEVKAARAPVTPLAEAPGISASDFKILSYRMVREGNDVRVKGEVQNNGRVAAGVELEAISRDENGVLLDAKKFWPNSVSNLPPGKSCGVSTTVSTGPYAKSVDLKIVSARIW